MSFSEVLAELPKLTVAERQTLMKRTLELDAPDLSTEDLSLVENRLAGHRRNPKSAVPLESMKAKGLAAVTMKWRVEFRPEVELDMAEAAEWYESRQPGLGVEFIEEVVRVWDSLSENPLLNSRRLPNGTFAGVILTASLNE